MNNGIIDKISLVLLSLFLLTISYTMYEWFNNAFEQHKHWVYAVDSNNEGIIASASKNQILLWKDTYCIGSIEAHSNTIKSISFSDDNALIVSGGLDKKVNVWSITDNKTKNAFDKHIGQVNMVRFSLSDKYIISGGYDKKLFIWDWKSDTVIKEFDNKGFKFSINKNNVLAYIDTFCNIQLFDLNNLSSLKSIPNNCGNLAFHPNGEIIASINNDGIINLINVSSGKHISQLDMKRKNHYRNFVFTPNGDQIITSKSGGGNEIWDWRKNKSMGSIKGPFGYSTNELKLDNNGQLLGALGDRSVKIWNIENGELISSLGNGEYKSKRLGILYLIMVILLLVGFKGVYESSTNLYSSWAVMTVLTFWTCGIFLIGLLKKELLSKISIGLNGILTAISFLLLVSVYGIVIAFFTIPVSLSLAYYELKTGHRSKLDIIPLEINLIFVMIPLFLSVLGGLINKIF